MKAGLGQRRRREYRISRLAGDLGISVSTIKRRLKDHHNLADALRATKHGGEWRFNYPTSEAEYVAYLTNAKAALDRATHGRLGRHSARSAQQVEEYIRGHFPNYSHAYRDRLIEAVENTPNAGARRLAKRHLAQYDYYRRRLENVVRPLVKQERAADRKRSEKLEAELDEYFGFGDKQRELDVASLTQALIHKRARMQKNTEGGWDDTDFDRWEADAKQIPATARQIASRFNCRIRDTIGYWREHLERLSEKNRRHNDQEIAQLCRFGSLAPDVVDALRKAGTSNEVQNLRVSGKFITSYVQIWPVKTPTQITEQCEQIKKSWPEPKDWPAPGDWRRESKEIRRTWGKETLFEAAFELARDGKPINQHKLRLLLFRDEQHETAFKNYMFRQEEDKRLAGRPHTWIGQPHLRRPDGHRPKRHERASPYHGERGISRREFCQRYRAIDIKEARVAASKTLALEPEARISAPVVPTGAWENPVTGQFWNPERDNHPDHFETVSQVEAASQQNDDGDNLHCLDQRLRPILSHDERDRRKDGFVTGQTAWTFRRKFQEDKELLELLRPERAADRAIVEKALGVPLEEYLKKPFAEIP